MKRIAQLAATAAVATVATLVPATAHATTPPPFVAHVKGHGDCGVTPHTARHRWTVKCPRDGFKRSLRPCREEDSRNCYWDARRAGNQVGASFIDVRGHASHLRAL